MKMTFFFRRCLLLFLGCELLIFFVIYCFGPKSLKSLQDIKQRQVHTRNEILQLEQEILKLKNDVADSQTSFAKEKAARERLLMKKDDETVYFKNNLKVI